MIPRRTEDRTNRMVERRCHLSGNGLLRLITAVCLVILGLGGFESVNAIGGRAGVGIGIAFSEFDKEIVEFAGPDLSSSRTAWRLFGGLHLNRNLGVEAGYVYLAKDRLTEDVHGDYFEAKVNGFEFTPIGLLSVGKHLTAFARGGIIFWHSDMVTARFGGPGSGTKKESGASPALGIGVEYDLNEYLGLRAEYTRYAVDKAKAGLGDFNFLALNGVFAFGRK